MSDANQTGSSVRAVQLPTGGFPLDQLGQRECAVVQRVDAGTDDMGRLQAMGVCQGRTLELVQRGDPLIIRVLGTRIGLSARLASRVFVERCSKTCDLIPGQD